MNMLNSVQSRKQMKTNLQTNKYKILHPEVNGQITGSLKKKKKNITIHFQFKDEVK